MALGRRGLVIVASAAVVVAALGGLWTYEASRPATTVQVHLEIVPDASGRFVFSPTTISVPQHARVAFTIVNHDPGNHSVAWAYCNVSGTADGMMESAVPGMGPGMMGDHSMHGLLPGQVSHTFTMQGDGYALNVPIPPAASASQPSSVSFTVVTGGPFSATWQCEADGMAYGMGPSGGMMGGVVAAP